MTKSSPSGRQSKNGDPGVGAREAGRTNSRANGKPRAALSAEAITQAAIRIADAEGLDAVSIRRVAGALDARPMSLYDHFASKGELLASMANKATEEVLLPQPLPEGWRMAMSAIARHMYATLASHPWLVFVFAQQPRFGPNAVRLAEQMASAMEGLEVAPEEFWAIPGTINDYVLGHSLRAAAGPGSSDLEEVIPRSDMAAFPELASLPDSLRSRASLERFEFGLQIVLDGIERHVGTDGE